MLELADMRPSGQEIVMAPRASWRCLAEDTPRNLQSCHPTDHDEFISAVFKKEAAHDLQSTERLLPCKSPRPGPMLYVSGAGAFHMEPCHHDGATELR